MPALCQQANTNLQFDGKAGDLKIPVRTVASVLRTHKANPVSASEGRLFLQTGIFNLRTNYRNTL